MNEKGFVNYPADRMDDQDDVLSYLKLDPDHHEKIAALIPKVGDLYLHVMRIWFDDINSFFLRLKVGTQTW